MRVDPSLDPAEVAAITREAYIYSFPMLMGYRYAYATFLQPASPAYRGPANAGPHGEARTLDHRSRDVITPNADTPYSFGLLDLRAGPLVLSVPAVSDRYYVMQFEDLYGHNDLHVGSRSTGTGVGTWFLTGPGWQGELPEGFSGSHRFETDLVFLIGRSQLLGPDDAPALAAIMRQYRLEPYAVFAGDPAPELPPDEWPRWDDEASRDEPFLGYLNALTDGLVRDADGALTITMQRTEPDDPVERANWLPTPDGPFTLALRMYWPGPAALDGTWFVPPVTRVG